MTSHSDHGKRKMKNGFPFYCRQIMSSTVQTNSTGADRPTRTGATRGRKTFTRPTQGRPTQGRPTQGRDSQGRDSQGRPTQGRPTQGRDSQTGRSRTIECFNCHQQVNDLRAHRAVCTKPREYREPRSRDSHEQSSTRPPRRPIECFNCHQQVDDLRAHRAVCQSERPRRPIECFNCHQQVDDLRAHRSECRPTTRSTGSSRDSTDRDGPSGPVVQTVPKTPEQSPLDWPVLGSAPTVAR